MINGIYNYVPCSVRVPPVAHLLIDPTSNWPEFFPPPPKLCLCATPTQSMRLMVEQCHLRPQHLEETRHQKCSTKASVPPVSAFEFQATPCRAATPRSHPQAKHMQYFHPRYQGEHQLWCLPEHTCARICLQKRFLSNTRTSIMSRLPMDHQPVRMADEPVHRDCCHHRLIREPVQCLRWSGRIRFRTHEYGYTKGLESHVPDEMLLDVWSTRHWQLRPLVACRYVLNINSLHERRDSPCV